MPRVLNRKVLSWALYDWANSAFATAVLAGFFPIFFKQYWSAGSDPTTSTFQLGLANSTASLVIVILAPVLGAIADVGGIRKRFLALFALLGILMTTGLYFVGAGQTAPALVLFALSMVGFSGSIIFYDALIVSVTGEEHYDIVSAWGYALGYLGGGLLFAGTVAMTLWPAWFGLADAVQAVKVAFLCVAVWWLVFSLPLLLYVPEQASTGEIRPAQVARAGFRQLVRTFSKVRRLRYVALFLLAYWLYIDGVDTVVRMAVDYGMSLGFSSTNLITALLITQFVGFPAAVAFGLLGERIGPKRAILIAIGVYLALTIWAYFLRSIVEFYALAVLIGLVQGGVQSLSRSVYARLIPAGQAAEFFGFYNMLGKFAAILGPLLVGLVGLATGSSRLGMLSISVLFVSGGILLYCVDIEKGKQAARLLQQNIVPGQGTQKS
ncbi:MAG TPA: MFS transporter [Chromatiales bacterium]|nr:MFS transporter [Chromatiales bacterium]